MANPFQGLAHARVGARVEEPRTIACSCPGGSALRCAPHHHEVPCPQSPESREARREAIDAHHAEEHEAGLL